MTTTRKRPTARPARPATPKKPTPAVHVRAETLDEFDAQLRDHLNTDVGFADTVRSLWVTRQRLAALTSARKAVFEQVKLAYEDGTRKAAGYEIRQTQRGEASTYRAVEAATVKKHAPAAYAAARTLVRRVSVTAPANGAPPVPIDPTPKLPRLVTAEQAVAAYKADVFALIKQYKEDETALIERLDKIAADAGWDGEEVAFADGWRAATVRRQFNGDYLREIDPDTWDKLAVTKVKEAAPRVYVAKPGADDDGAVDLDAE